MALLFLGIFSGSVNAQNAAAPIEDLGFSAAVSGDYAVVGAAWHDGYKGAAYLYRRQDGRWVQVQKLSPPDLGRYDHFGASVSISGDVVVVGAAWQDLFRGAAYVFTRDGDEWVQSGKLTADDAKVETYFGHEVRIEGDRILVAEGTRPDALEFEISGNRWIEREKTGVRISGAGETVDQALMAEEIIASDEREMAVEFGAENIALTLSAAGVPTAPDSVKATGGALSPLEPEVEITWWPSEDPGAEQEAIIYKVLRDGVLLSVLSSDDTQYSDVTGDFGQTYQYGIVVKDMTGFETGPVLAAGERIIFSPIKLAASDGEFMDKVRLTWVDVSAINTGYSIRRNGVEIATAGSNAAFFDDTTAFPMDVYSYEVAATLDGYESDPAVDTSGWLDLVLPPMEVSATDGQYLDRVVITWQNQAPDTCQYIIYRDDQVIKVTDENATSHVDSTIGLGVAATYCVATKKPGGASGVAKDFQGTDEPNPNESVRICDEGGTLLDRPSEFSASTNLFDDRIRLTWVDVSNVEDGFEISRMDLSGGPGFVVIDTTGADATQFDDFTADPGTLYLYQIRAINDLGGASAYNAAAGSQSVVLSPTNVSASEGTFEDHVAINWESTSTTAVLFKIYRDGAFIKSVSSGDRMWRDYGGTAGQTYDYQVRAVTALESESGGPVVAGRRDLLMPTQFVATDDAYEDRTLLTWTENSRLEAGYAVIREDTVAAVADTFLIGSNRTTWTDYEGVSGISYLYSVAAFDSLGSEVGYSGFAAATGRRTLLAPTDIEVAKGEYEDRVTLAWRDNSDAEAGYRIYRDDILVGTRPDNSISYVDLNPDFGDTLAYQVRAYDDWGESEAVTDSGYTTLLAPVAFNASDFYGDRIEMTWVDRSSIEEGFEILRDGEIFTTISEPDATSYTVVRPVGEGFYDTPGWVNDVAIAGGYAYLASSGLRIVDITDPSLPTLVSQPLPSADRIEVAGDYAYVSDFDIGLQIVNVSDPYLPTVVGTYDVTTQDVPPDIGLYGGYAYLTTESGFEVVDISDPSDPTHVFTYSLSFANNVVIAGDYAYVTHYDPGLRIFDLSVPTAPDSIGSYGVERPADIAVAGSYAYMTIGDTGLEIIDVSDPAQPTHAATFAMSDPRGVALAGGYAFAATADSLLIIDISDPTLPVQAQAVGTLGVISGVAVDGDFVYIAENIGLEMFAWPLLLSPEQDDSYQFSVQAFKGGTTSASSSDEGRYSSETSTSTMDVWGKLLASDGAAGDNFGSAVSMDGDLAIVGAMYDDGNGPDSGAAYVFEFIDGDWTEVQKLTAGDGASGDNFGYSVCIRGDRAIVGAYGVDGGSSREGAAYVFEFANGTWSQDQKLTASVGDSYDEFGRSVSIDGNWAIVGSYGDDDNGSSAGAAYVFEYGGSAWSQVQKLMPIDGDFYDHFGYSVSMDGNWAVAGAYRDDDNGPISGSAYLFELVDGTWTEFQKLTASDGASSDELGESVSISGERLILGADDDDDNGTSSGSAYLFELVDGTWTETQKIKASDGTRNDRFGNPVTISGDRAIVGALLDGEEATWVGCGYVFQRVDGQWIETTKISASDGEQMDRLGYSVAVSGNRAILGAIGDDDNGDNAGAVYAFEMPARPRNIVATDGTVDSRVSITWDDRSLNEQEFRVYRDGQPIASVAANTEVYEDFDAQPGRTYEYGVSAMANDFVTVPIVDLGWRPANGNIAGHISTIAGAGADSVRVAVSPLPTRALQFDGGGGYVEVEDIAGGFDFGSAPSYTVEAWIRYLATPGAADQMIIAKADPAGGQAGFPFALGNRSGSGEPGRLSFAVSDSATTVTVSTARDSLADNQWHHVACVRDAVAEMVHIYVDGVLDGSASCVGLGDVDNDEALTLGAGPGAGSWYGGLLDEIRIWNVARGEAEIQSAMAKRLTGTEIGLVAYWPIGWPSGYQGEGSSNVITDRCSGAHYGELRDGVYWTDTCAPIDIDAVTDLDGNFVIPDIYYGTEAEFEVRPYDGNKQFDPPVKRVVLTTESPVENQVAFTDVSSFTVSGTIRYADTDCAAADIPILVDSRPAGSTDSRGKFAVTADLGQHSVRPELAGHTFSDSVVVFVDDDVSLNDENGVAFTDSTTYALSGRLGGGCGRPIGDITITVRSENDCLLHELPYAAGDTVYSVSLPPQTYLVSAEVDPATIPDGLSKADVVEFFQNLGVRAAVMDSLDVDLDFQYRAPLNVAITGFEEYREVCDGPLMFEGRTLPDGLPVVPQLTLLHLIIEVNEDYGLSGLCPVDSATVVVYDELFDRQNAPVELEVLDGIARYTTCAATPNLVIGRTDEEGNDRSFQKSIRAVVDVEGRIPVSATEWALVTGHLAPEGADFVTGIADMPLFVLRDPPGDGSSSFFEEGHTIRTRYDWDNNIFSWQAGVEIAAEVGVHAQWFVGLGAGYIGELETVSTFENDFMAGNTRNEEHWTDITLETKRRFETSTHNSFVGEQGDVFFGVGYNFIFSEVSIIDVADCEVTKSYSIGFEPDSISTLYTYTHQYLQDFLIPELDQKVDYYQDLVNQGQEDQESELVKYQEQRDTWQQAVDENRELKTVEDQDAVNRSFSAGAEFTYYAAEDTTRWYTRTNSFVMDTKLQPLNIEWETDYAAYSFKLTGTTHVENIGDFADTTGTYEHTVGYTLYDGDIGDRFTVDIKNDGHYPTPVFDVLAGASSCPYEPWPSLEDSVPRMLARDNPTILPSTLQRDGVPADQPAEFTINLANESATGEGRIYELRLITNSNPYGAVVSVGGVPLLNGVQEYYIDGGQSLQATVTVERGPSHYRYVDRRNDDPAGPDERLKLLFCPACEYDLWLADQRNLVQQSDTLSISVTFDAPCSDITMLLPESGWTYTAADHENSETIDILLTDYELDIGVDGGTIQMVGAQCRRLGSGDTGPSPWQDCVAPQVPGTEEPLETLFEWTPSEALADGVYELMAYTQCANGYGYSQVATGTIARHGPMVLGTPEPADGELSLGEDISLTFNTPIDCQSVLVPGNVILTYLSGPDSNTTIDFETVCDGRTVVISPTASPNDMEAQRIEARVTGVTDESGNSMVGEAVWEFDYRKSLFTWSRLHLTTEVPYRDPGAVTAALVNGTGQPVDFEFTPLPSWITSATPATGTIPPGDEQLVSFAIQDDLEVGVYEGVVAAAAVDTSRGVAVMDVSVTVSCDDPGWVVDPGLYEHTMTVVADLVIDIDPSRDDSDLLAAFVGNQLRGVAPLEHVGAVDKYLAFLTVHGNRSQGETVRFQVWDDSDCKLYNATEESFPFLANESVGSVGAPERLTAAEIIGTGQLTVACNDGWTWISTNIASADMSTGTVLSDLTPADGDLFKSQSAFSQFAGEAWEGALLDVDNVSSYMIRLTGAGEVVHDGPVAPISTPVPVQQGWNWIGYLPQGPQDVTESLADLDSGELVVAGDIIKSQNGFAEFAGGIWYGSLDSLRTGGGYKLHLASPVDSSFVYSPYVPSAPIDLAAKAMPPEKLDTTPAWGVRAGGFQHNMTMTAVLRIDGTESIDERDMVGAFVGDECRGVARPVYIASLQRYEVFLMVHSNETGGEGIELRAFDADAATIYDITESLTFEADAVQGSVTAPIVLTASEVYDGEGGGLPRAFALGQNRPNPFNPTTDIDYNVPASGGKVSIKIYDVAGRRVRTLVDTVQEPGKKTVTWNGRGDRGEAVAAGLYFYRMTAPGFEKTRKLIMIK